MNVKFYVDDMTIYENIWSIGWLKYCMKYWIILSKSGWPNLSTAERLCKVDVNPLALVFSLYSFLAPLLVALYSIHPCFDDCNIWNPYEIHMKSLYLSWSAPLEQPNEFQQGLPRTIQGAFGAAPSTGCWTPLEPSWLAMPQHRGVRAAPWMPWSRVDCPWRSRATKNCDQSRQVIHMSFLV